MKKLFMLSLIFATILSSCKKEKLPNGQAKLSLQVEQVNENFDTYSSALKSIRFSSLEQRWYINHLGKGEISKELVLLVELENDKNFEIGFKVRKDGEALENIVLEDVETVDDRYGKAWHYISNEVEFENFYKNYTVININFGGSFLPINGIKLEEVKEKKLNGSLKNQVSITFSGTANGAFDPEGIWAESYQISGEFIGFIEVLDL